MSVFKTGDRVVITGVATVVAHYEAPGKTYLRCLFEDGSYLLVPSDFLRHAEPPSYTQRVEALGMPVPPEPFAVPDPDDD